MNDLLVFEGGKMECGEMILIARLGAKVEDDGVLVGVVFNNNH